MAERRMFAKTIVLSDSFLDMPMSSRCLYFTLGMLADDDGFVNSPKSIMRQCGCTEDDLKILLAKKFIIGFETGIIVVKHWRINNYLRNDRYTETKYTEEKKALTIEKNGAYSLGIPVGIPDGIPSVYQMDTQVSIGKDSKEKIINTSCSEPSFGSSEPEAAPADPKPKKERKPTEPEEPAVITLQLNDGSEHGISQRQIDDFQALYPAVDVMQALRDMKGWCISNPTKRKTKSGIMRFVNSWLSREQNRPAAGNNYQQQKQTGGIKNGFDAAFYGYGDY